jgi:hypothetical protein
VDVATAAQHRGRGGEHGQTDGDAENDHETIVERGSDQLREEVCAGEDMLMGGGERGQHAGRAKEMRHRIVTEHGREQRGDRRQGGDLMGDGVGHALLLQAAEQLGWEAARDAGDQEREEHADRQRGAGVLEG